MTLIPQSGKLSQPGNSDLFGNLWATKNLNLDEEGYIKLASRVVSFKSEKDDANFNMPLSFGRATGEFHIATADQAFDLALLESGFSIAEDSETNNPTATFDSWGKWFQNRWHISTATKIWYSTGGTWTDTAVSLTTGKVHAMENFVNKSSLVVSNGNTVLLLDTSYSTTVTLTIPADFEIIALAYSNAKMGVVTMMSDTAAGQNQEAFFFIWDGSGSSAGQLYPIGSDTIMAIAAYKSSWVILTRAGELKYFNGGGFETLATLPFYFAQATWGDSQNRETYGDIMRVEGSVIYINIGNDLGSFGKKGERYLQNHPAGVLCYDPKVGLYHRYAPSISPAYYISVLSGGVDISTNILTADSGTIPSTGSPIKQVNTAGSVIGGVEFNGVYFVIKLSSTTFALAETKEKALAGIKVDLTAANAAKFVAVEVLDYGVSYVGHSGGIGIVEARKEIADHLLFGSEVQDFASTTEYDTLCITIPGFENRGYLMTPKAVSLGTEDNQGGVVVKHRPLHSGDKIIVKIKDKDVLGLPTSTPQFASTSVCSWLGTDILSTTADLSDVKTYLDASAENECELEVISGAGAGVMVKISSISVSGTTYSITLDEEVPGAASGYKCNVVIDNWRVLKTDADESYISNSNTKGWEYFPIASSSKWAKFKVELRGYETTIEEFRIINKEQIK